MEPRFTGLTPFLADGPAGSSGLMITEYTAASALAEIRAAAAPATVGQRGALARRRGARQLRPAGGPSAHRRDRRLPDRDRRRTRRGGAGDPAWRRGTAPSRPCGPRSSRPRPSCRSRPHDRPVDGDLADRRPICSTTSAEQDQRHDVTRCRCPVRFAVGRHRRRRPGRRRRAGGYARFAWTDADLTLREWFARRGRPARADGRGRPRRQPVGLVGQSRRHPRRRRRQPPRLGAQRRRLRRSARRGVFPRRDRCAASRRLRPGPSDRGGQLRRRGRRPIRRRLRRLADVDRAADCRTPARRLVDADGVSWLDAAAGPASTPATSVATTPRCAESARSSNCTSSRVAA